MLLLVLFNCIATAFLPGEVVELKRQNVDINPEYGDSLDVEMFTVHLMFEKIPVEGRPVASNSSNKNNNINANGTLPQYHTQTRSAFEAGLDEVS